LSTLDTERELGVPDRCDQKLFDYALTYVNDSSLHYRADDVTNVSSDGNLTASNLFLGYECRALWNFEAGYAVLKKNLPARSYASAKMVLYYTQKFCRQHGRKFLEDICIRARSGRAE